MDGTTALAVGSSVAAALLFSGAAWQFVGPRDIAAEKLAEFTGEADRDDESAGLGSLAKSAARLAGGTESDVVATRRWLVQAGLRGRTAVEMYSASRTLGLVFGALVSFLLANVLRKTSLAWAGSSILFGATLGYYVPYLYVANLLQKRKDSILKSFPDALDLLVSAVEAGLGLDAAFRRVAEEMGLAAPELASELQLVNHEVMGGIPRVDAMRRLDERVGVDEVTSLVNVLIQAERFGSSVARALRVHSEHIRIKRMQRAETKAAQVSPKLTITMILFILPTLLIILLGPAAISMKNILLPTVREQGLGQR